MKKNIFNILFHGFLITMLLAGFSSCSKDSDNTETKKDPVVPDKVIGDTLRLVSYNVGVFSKYEKGNYETIANMMKELEPDCVFLCELDSCTTRTDNVFQIKRFSDLMGWNYSYGKAMAYQGGYYGEGISCKGAILRKYAVQLPQYGGSEPRVLAVAELENYILAATHLDQASADAQLKQVDIINRTLTDAYKNCGKPVFIGGDFNAVPSSATILAMKSYWKIISVQAPTFSSGNPTKCIDYVMQLNNGVKCQTIRSTVPLSFKSGSVTQASDHLPIYVDVVIPKSK